MIDELAILRRLVACPSENPPGDERAVAATCAELLEALGADVALHSSAAGRPNVVGRVSGAGGGPRVILQAHLDTKPTLHHGGPEAWTSDPYQLTLRLGRAYGLGAVDTKGGAAAQLAACSRCFPGADESD